MKAYRRQNSMHSRLKHTCGSLVSFRLRSLHLQWNTYTFIFKINLLYSALFLVYSSLIFTCSVSPDDRMTANDMRIQNGRGLIKKFQSRDWGIPLKSSISITTSRIWSNSGDHYTVSSRCPIDNNRAQGTETTSAHRGTWTWQFLQWLGLSAE
jgi:hypothetical protein